MHSTGPRQWGACRSRRSWAARSANVHAVQLPCHQCLHWRLGRLLLQQGPVELGGTRGVLQRRRWRMCTPGAGRGKGQLPLTRRPVGGGLALPCWVRCRALPCNTTCLGLDLVRSLLVPSMLLEECPAAAVAAHGHQLHASHSTHGATSQRSSPGARGSGLCMPAFTPGPLSGPMRPHLQLILRPRVQRGGPGWGREGGECKHTDSATHARRSR